MNFSEIEKNLKLNQHIQADIRQIVYECYYDIYNYLGRTGFIKWVDKQKLTVGIRNIIFKSLTEKEDEYLKNNRGVVGYHRRPIDLSQKENIVLRKGVGDNKDTNAHEIFHSIVDGLGGFNQFWGEGITEFCKKAMYNRSQYSYPKNVEMVFLAYSMFGNIILKDYFSKQGDKFNFHLAKGADNTIFQAMMKTGRHMNNYLESYHNIIYNKKDPTPDDFKLANENLVNGIEGLLSIYYMYNQKQIESFKHIKEGKVDFNKFIDEQVKISKYLQVLVPYAKDFQKLFDQNIFIREKLIEKMVEHSHLLFNKTDEEKNQIMTKIKIDIHSKIANRSTGKYLDIRETKINQELEEPYKTLNENATGKLVVSFLYNDDGKDFVSTIKKIADIQAATKDFSTEEIIDTIKIIDEKMQRKNALAILGDSKNFSRTIENISQLEQQYECEIEIPTFRKVHIEGLDNLNTFIEFGTDKQALIVIDPEQGKMDRISLDELFQESSDFNMFTYKKLNKKDLSCSLIVKGEKVSDIVINPNSKDIKITNGRIDEKPIIGIDSIYEDTLNSLVFKSIKKDIKNCSYSHGVSSEQKVITTARISGIERKIDVDKFIEDYKETQELIPGVDKQGNDFIELSEELIDTTFEPHLIPKQSESAEEYEEQKYALIRDMRMLLQEKKQESNKEKIDEIHKKISDDLEILNTTVDKATEKENIGVLVGRKKSSDSFLKDAVDGTKKRVRSENINRQIEFMRQIRLLKRGLPMKDEKGKENYGER